MEETILQKHVKSVYNEINNKWLQFHMRLLGVCSLIGIVLEIEMFFIINAYNILNCSVSVYWIKYIISPAIFNIIIVSIGFFSLKCKRLSVVFKQYLISILCVMFAFVLCLAHSGFIVTLVVAIFPILMTILYENQKLTAIVSFLCLVSQFLSGKSLFWDPAKELNSAYNINLYILIAFSFCTWFACYIMINFLKAKSKKIVTNDIERHHLQERINIDGLTGVGSKHSLTNYLSDNTANFSYLAMIDIDNFKKINDTYGHVFGDDVLRCIGDAMRYILNDSKSFRYGGDEFCILFSNTSIEATIKEITAISEYINANLELSDFFEHIFISVGITNFSIGKSPTILLQQADTALYESKKTHGTQITIFDEKP